jgi:hypothetical protein
LRLCLGRHTTASCHAATAAGAAAARNEALKVIVNARCFACAVDRRRATKGEKVIGRGGCASVVMMLVGRAVAAAAAAASAG